MIQVRHTSISPAREVPSSFESLEALVRCCQAKKLLLGWVVDGIITDGWYPYLWRTDPKSFRQDYNECRRSPSGFLVLFEQTADFPHFERMFEGGIRQAMQDVALGLDGLPPSEITKKLVRKKKVSYVGEGPRKCLQVQAFLELAKTKKWMVVGGGGIWCPFLQAEDQKVPSNFAKALTDGVEFRVSPWYKDKALLDSFISNLFPFVEERFQRFQGEDALARGDFQEAEIHFTASLELNPKNTKALSGRVDAFLGLQNKRSALADLNTLIGECPDDMGLYLKKAIHEGDEDQAVDACLAALSRRPGQEGLLKQLRARGDHAVNRGATLLRTGNVEAAIAHLSRVLEADPSFADAYATRANCHLHAKDFTAALKDAEQCLRLHPNHTEAAKIKAEAAKIKTEALQQQAELEVEKEKAVAKDLVNEGNAKMENQDYVKATELFSQALSLSPRNEDACVQRAKCYLKLRNYEACLRDLEGLHAREAKLLRAQALFYKQDFEAAVQAYDVLPGDDDFDKGYWRARKALEKSQRDDKHDKAMQDLQKDVQELQKVIKECSSEFQHLKKLHEKQSVHLLS